MAISTPICNFGEKSHDFSLKSTEDKICKLNDVKGENGYLIMFICNHCPYVQAVINFLVDDAKYLESIGIKSAAIMSNDTKNYPEDSFENMKKFAEENNFSFIYSVFDPLDPLTVILSPSILTVVPLGKLIFFFPIFDIKIPYKLFLHQYYFFLPAYQT